MDPLIMACGISIVIIGALFLAASRLDARSGHHRTSNGTAVCHYYTELNLDTETITIAHTSTRDPHERDLHPPVGLPLFRG